mgnify:CR=1 FL=1
MNEPLDPVELTRTLVAFDTINPPGNERPCAEYLGRLLEDGGFSVSYHESWYLEKIHPTNYLDRVSRGKALVYVPA